jgi:hypothetical protein
MLGEPPIPDMTLIVPLANPAMRVLVACVGTTVATLSCAAVISFDDYSEQHRVPADAPDAAHLYALRGSVDGLPADAGTNVFMNGIQLVNVHNGPFAFPPSLPDGVVWRVSAFSELRSCAAQPASGVISGRDVGDVAVRCTSNDAALSRLSFVRNDLDVVLTPVFASEVLQYDVLSGSAAVRCVDMGSGRLEFEARQADSTVTILGERLGSSGRSARIGPSLEDLTVSVEVTAASGTSRKYTLRIRGYLCS